MLAAPLALAVLAMLLGAGAADARAAGQSHSCGWGAFSAAAPPPACWRPFADGSFLNTPLPAAPRLRQTSADYVARLMDSGDGRVRGLHPLPPRGGDFNHPYVFSAPGDPEYTVSCDRDCADPDDGDLTGARVRIPCGARPAVGTDRHLAVLDQAAGLEWDFFDVQTDLSHCRGGALAVGTAGTARIDGAGRASCATAACVALTAGIIRFPELEAESIQHALFMVNGVDCDQDGVFPHEIGAPCYLFDPEGMAEGQWFRLDRTPAEIDALPGITGWQRAILRAMATYGMFVGDQGSNGAFELQTESPQTYRGARNPWHTWARRQQEIPGSNIAYDGRQLYLDFPAGLPENYFRDHLQAVDPCAIQRTCWGEPPAPLGVQWALR